MAEVNLQELVSKCAPVVYYFPGNSYVPAEQNLPSSVDYYVAGVRYVRASGQTFEPGWTWSEVAPMESGDFLEIVDASVQGGNLDNATLYVHVLPVTGDPALVDIQYWFFFPYNGDETVFASLGSGGDALVALPIPFSRREGDWEHIVVRTDLTGTIAAVFYAQHAWGSWLNEAAGDNPDGYTTHQGHPIVYCAVGSHASYSSAGGPFPIAEVTPDGVRIGLEDFTGLGASVDYSEPGRTLIVKNDVSSINFDATPPPWLAFPGRWGQTQISSNAPAHMGHQVLEFLMTQTSGGLWGALKALDQFDSTAALVGDLVIAIHDWDGPVTPSFQRTWSSEPLELVWSTDSPVPAQATPIEIALWGDMDGSLNCAMLASPQTAALALAYLVGEPSGSQWGWGSVGAPHAETIGPVAGINAGAPLTELIVTLWAGNLRLMLYDRGVNPPVGLPIVGWPAPALGSGAALAYFANRWYVFYIAADGSLNVVTSSDRQQWSVPTALSNVECATPDSFGVGGPAAAVLPGGTTLVVVCPGLPTTTVTRQHGATNWTFRTNPLYSVTTTDGTSWTTPFQISNSQTVGGAALAPDAAGTMYCAFADSNQHTCYTATSDGQIWNQVGAIPGSGSTVPPGLAVTNNGELVCVHKGTDGKLWATTTPVAGS